MQGSLIRNIRWAVLSQMNRMGLANTEYALCEQFAIDCYTDELRLLTMKGVEVYRQVVNSVGSIPFPPGYIKYTKIGIDVGGRIQTLTLDSDLMLKKPTICGSLEESTSDQYYFVPHYFNGAYYPGLYTQGGGISDAGYYRIDDMKRQIQISPAFSGKEIVIEYQSSGEASGSTLVPAEFINCMRYYIGWKYFEYKQGMENRALLEYANYSKYFEEGKIQHHMFTDSEFLDTLFQTSGYKF